MSTDRRFHDSIRQLIAAGEEEASALRGVLPKVVPSRDSVPGYEILSELGRGGMGVVYKAIQLSTKRAVALKVMLAGQFASTSARLRFQREIELCARLQHPGIVRVLESGLTAGGEQYYAMDHVEAVPLDRWVLLSRPDVGDMMRTFVKICEAVDHAHCHGIIHRDLKPGNVLIDKQGSPHILDFGLAKCSEGVERTEAMATISMPGQLVGTLRYLSPEQARGRSDEVDARTDVYALGVILFEALTGSPPYSTTGHPSAVIGQILDAIPAHPSSISNRVDGDLEAIVLKALEKERDRRYQSAREMGEDMQRYLNGEAVVAKPPSGLYRLRKRLWRNRLQIALVAMAIVLAAAGVWGGRWWLNRSMARNQARERALLDGDILVKRRQFREGINQYNQILAAYPDLDPDVAYAHRAMAYLCEGRYDESLQDWNSAVGIAGTSSPWHYYKRATLLWITNQADKAADDYRIFLDHYAKPSYAPVRLFLVLNERASTLDREGQAFDAGRLRAEADKRLDEFMHKPAVSGSWLQEICRCLAGQLDPQELINRGEKRSPNTRCEAYYYAGEVYRLRATAVPGDGRTGDWMGKARKCFQKCVGTDLMFDPETGAIDPMNEYYLARWRLGQMTRTEGTSQPAA